MRNNLSKNKNKKLDLFGDYESHCSNFMNYDIDDNFSIVNFIILSKKNSIKQNKKSLTAVAN